MATWNVLFVDDSLGDQQVLDAAIYESQAPLRLHTVSSGTHCLAFLKRQGSYASAPVPDLILLDVNMPMIGGLQVLRSIRADSRWSRIAIAMFSTSTRPGEHEDARVAGADAFITKPPSIEQLMELAKRLAAALASGPDRRAAIKLLDTVPAT